MLFRVPSKPSQKKVHGTVQHVRLFCLHVVSHLQTMFFPSHVLWHPFELLLVSIWQLPPRKPNLPQCLCLPHVKISSSTLRIPKIYSTTAHRFGRTAPTTVSWLIGSPTTGKGVEKRGGCWDAFRPGHRGSSAWRRLRDTRKLLVETSFLKGKKCGENPGRVYPNHRDSGSSPNLKLMTGVYNQQQSIERFHYRSQKVSQDP